MGACGYSSKKRSCKSKIDLQNQTQSGRRYSKHKSRLVARGFTQKPDIDFYDTFCPVARLETIRIVIVVVAQNKWNIFHLDVKSTYLNEKLDEENYVEQPKGFFVQGG